jgi:hypothetical protein
MLKQKLTPYKFSCDGEDLRCGLEHQLSYKPLIFISYSHYAVLDS